MTKKVLVDAGAPTAPPVQAPPFTCKYCGSPSWIEPSDQSLPPDYCHESDHGEPPEQPAQDAVLQVV